MRYYDVNSGAILLDDHNIRISTAESFAMPLVWCCRIRGCSKAVSWKISATAGSMPRMREVIAAAKAARAHHFIQTLPGGYQMELNEDASNVSRDRNSF